MPCLSAIADDDADVDVLDDAVDADADVVAPDADAVATAVGAAFDDFADDAGGA